MYEVLTNHHHVDCVVHNIDLRKFKPAKQIPVVIAYNVAIY